MTTITLFNQLTAMPKRLAMVLTVLFTLGVGSMWGDITLTTSDVTLSNFSSFSGSGYKTVSNYTISNYSGFSVTDCMLSSSSLQMKASYGKLVSPTIISPAGFDIEITYTSATNMTVAAGGSSTTAASVLKLSTNSTSTSFTLSVGSKYAVVSKIVLKPKAGAPKIVILADDNTELIEASAGGGVNLPERDDCGDWTFVGWTEGQFTDGITNQPVIIKDNPYKPSVDITLYPVYSKTEGGSGNTTGSKTFTLSTIANANDWENGVAYTSIEDAPVTITAEGGGNNGKWYTSSSGSWRVYNGGTVRITADGGTITSVTSTPTCDFTINDDKATFSPSARTDFTKFVVEYSISGGATTTYTSTPDCATQTADCSLLKFTTDITGNYTATYTQNATATTLTVAAKYDNGSTGVTYQWYSNTSKSNTGGTAINGATNASYTPITSATGTKYYYCVATYDECEITSNVATIVVNAQIYTIKINPTVNGSVTVNPSEAAAGTTITLNPSPGSGFKLETLTVTRDDNAQPVQVTNNQFTMPASDVTVTAKFQAIQKLATPTNLSASDITTTSATLTWEWNESTFEAQLHNYNVYIYDATGTNQLSGPVTATEKSLSTTKINGLTLSPGTTYKFKVVALSKSLAICLNSNESDWGTFTTSELPKYTVSFSTGTGNPTQASITESEGGAGITLPTGPTPTCPDWTFAGWWTEEVSSTNTSPGTLLNADDTYNPTSDITLYAVYSKTETTQGGGENIESSAIISWSESTLSFSGNGWNSNTSKGYSGNYLRLDENQQYVSYSASTGTVSQIKFTYKLQSSTACAGHKDQAWWIGEIELYGSINSGSSWSKIDSKCISVNSGDNLGKDIPVTYNDLSSEGYNAIKIQFAKECGNLAIKGLSATSGGGSTTTTTYNSNPTCLVPVWEGATIDKTALTVNCGGRSPMTGDNGAAKITFSAEKIYNFTKDITIEATTGFLVSTSQSVDANYQSSVSLSPLVGTTNANTFYDKFVYVRAEAPAQSDTDLEGTIIIKNSKGETLQTFSVTADVTCTQYTLTLVDRGVSTEQPTKYYAGETINEAPADPEGVCTDPIHYVFDGWAEATVAAGATTYTKVTFPYTVTGDTKFYAVYRYLEGGGNGDYNLVTSALDDWSGDYLIAYSDQIFANGTIGGKEGIGAAGEKVDLSSYITNNTIPAAEGDKYKVTLEVVTGGYVLKTQDGKYNYHTNNTENDISARDKSTADKYPITVKFVSEEEINLCLGGNAIGSVFRYNAQGYFRFYKNGGQQPVYLYKKADGTTYYTTSPVCGPHLAITEGKDIYVTGGNAGGTRDLVIAQTKVSYKATRLEKDKSTGNLPSIKALPSNIVFDNTKTKAVAVTFDEDSVRTLQSDGTYTITGNITIAYQPAAANVTDDIQVTLNANYNPSADVSQASFTVHARSLPSEFVIVAKSGDKWYALNGDMNTNAANPANGQVTLDNDANPTKATYAPCNAIYTFDGVPNTGDRTYVRFQGTDGAWLWASSGTNVGIQNNVLKTTPEGSNKAYNWKLYTEDNITYRFGNANSSRQLTLNGEKFGMYASGVQDIRILPYDEKCLYNYAPSNLKVSVLKGTYVTLTWDAVAGATKYQYSTNGTTWTDAGTEPTVTINGLTGATKYIYYIRAYHEDEGVSQECIDYAEITFTTADCDDVPTNITYTADLNSITVSWTAAAPTATITYNTKEDGTGGGGTINNATSPYKISGGLTKNTTYYIQILADGTCASPIVPVKTEDVEVDIVEWQPQGIVVDINTDETVGVTLENEVSFGSGLGTEATELFFSKYYEASYNVKLVAIYNGTKNIIDLTDYTIQYGKTSWETNYITLKDFGATKGQIQPGEEIILYSYTENNADDKKILDCVHEDFPDGNWVEVTSSNNDGKGTLSFGGDKTIILCKTEYDDEADEYYDNIIDVIGALIEDPNEGILPTNKNTEKPSWGDKEGWVCEEGLSIADDSQIGISTNRCLLVRNNTVTSGLNAVEKNIEGDFVTLCSEWKGAQVPDSDIDNGVAASCENFAYVGTFDYSDYYTKYVPMGDEQVFDENARNADGTVTIPITDLYKHACSNIRVKLSNKDGEVLSDREYKVPIMITTTQGTDGEAFIALQQNLATKEVDAGGNVIATHPLSLEDVREICKTCDVVVRDNAILTKADDDAADDHPEVRDVYVYQNSSLIVPAGTNYTINNLSLRRKEDAVASVSAYPEALKLPESAAAPISLDFRLSAASWHWFTLPYDCNISEVTWVDGSPAQYNVDWFLMTYDGEKRAATQAGGCWKAHTGTTIKAGEGFILAINGNINNPAHTYELRFPMSKDVLVAEGTDKTVDVRAWGVETDIRPNHKGWNLIGNPYLAYYQRNNITNFEGLRLGQLTGPDPQTGYWEQTGNVPYVVVPIGAGWVAYEQVLASDIDLLPFTAYFVQVGKDGTHNSDQDLKVSFDHTKLQLSATPMPASIIQRSATEDEEPIIVGVSLTNAKGESDKTSLIIDDQYTDEYEMNADFFKWFGDYYTYYTKPVLYTVGADQGKRAFNALNEELATQPVALGMYAAQAGEYTFTLDLRSDLSHVEEIWLHDATENIYTNLLQDSYTFSTGKINGEGRFFLSVKMKPQQEPDPDPEPTPDPTPDSDPETSLDDIVANRVFATVKDNVIYISGLLSDAQLWIYDAAGRLMHYDQTKYYQHTYLVPQGGAYFVRVQGTMQTQTIKVVVK